VLSKVSFVFSSGHPNPRSQTHFLMPFKMVSGQFGGTHDACRNYVYKPGLNCANPRFWPSFVKSAIPAFISASRPLILLSSLESSPTIGMDRHPTTVACTVHNCRICFLFRECSYNFQNLHIFTQVLELGWAFARLASDPSIGTPKIYTTTGLGPRKNGVMAGVDDLVVYMQTVVKYNTFYIHHPGGAKRPRGGVYTNCCILLQFAYTPPNRPHQPFSYFF